MNKTWDRVSLDISFSQLCVFRADLKNPFNDWVDEHVEQGFSWRPGSVSFAALSDWECDIIVSVKNEMQLNDDCVRSIVVPFYVDNEEVAVSSIMSEEYIFKVPKGVYELSFHATPLEVSEEDGLFRVRYELIFIKSDLPKPRILIADDELKPPKEFLMHTNAAL
ncbi:competence protein ComJ [Marininema halotolerans]|uniref:Competence protein J (ComJ) n=1 Tax=Marininema halotolerans TaxID=1155944 RepID=A0A1I6ULZ4_9BACL|nr:competence protein ComJ [Marininema halotolerans]SFT02384.1 Competence protein J (ComJ) [Marininema halotolerans]